MNFFKIILNMSFFTRNQESLLNVELNDHVISCTNLNLKEKIQNSIIDIKKCSNLNRIASDY